MTTFVAIGRSNPGPSTECSACTAMKRHHGPEGECPRCDRCDATRLPANLTRLGNVLICPECLGKDAEHQITHQKPIKESPDA